MNTELSTEGVVVSIVLTLFILSLITERISEFIKTQFKSFYMKSENNPELERKRERNLLILSGAVGIIIALICNADFFSLIAKKGVIVPITSISDFTFRSVIGCIITGLFLGQGSKFFHDLLDALLYYKNVKKALYNKSEIENQLLRSNKSLVANEIITAVITPEQRNDNPDNNL